ncbi:TPA: restriction endonuclease subunit S [Streptococcus suis]|nr:restriction endonuclease subunit S [Streptococcus suis]
MPNKDKNIPKRRFKSFGNADAWELRKLGEVGEIERESVNPKLSPNNIFEEYSMPSFDVDRRPAYVLGKDMLSSRLKIQRSSLLINKLNVRQQRIWLVETPSENAICSSEFMPFVSEMVNLEFLREFFLSNETTKKLEELSTGTSNSQNRVSPKDIINFKLAIPSLPEQEAIGTFFSTLDRHITLHQRKLDKLKSVKQAYLSEMFPAEGERVPKRRFPGFTDDWELRKLGEIADVFDGTHQTPKYTNHGVMFLSVEDIATLKSEKYISLEDFEKEFKIFPEFNDVLMTRIGDIGTSNIVKTNDKIAYYVSLALIKPKKLESHFLNSIIQSKDFQNELWKRTLHIAFPKKINKGEISEVNLKFPSLPEQEAIGTFFSTLDRHITLHQRKLEKLKNLKKALLNELFV